MTANVLEKLEPSGEDDIHPDCVQRGAVAG